MDKQQTAKLKYLHITPRKVRLIANTLKNLSVKEAEAQLLVRPQRSSEPLLKLLRSAVANAKNKEMEEKKLFISSIIVNAGPVLKRSLPRAQGRATIILKRHSHVNLVLSEREQKDRFTITPPVKKDKKKKPAKEEKAEKDDKAPKKEAKEKKVEKAGVFRKIFRRKSI